MKYAFHEGVDICVLTNGLEWWLYLPMEPLPFEERQFATLRIRQDPIGSLANHLETFLGKENLSSGRAKRKAKEALKRLQECKLLRATIPEVWRELLTGPDDELLELVGKRVYDEVNLRPTREQVVRVIRCSPTPTVVPSEPVTPTTAPRHPQPDPKPSRDNQPTGIRLWGHHHTVKYLCVEVLRRVAEALYERQFNDFDRVLALRGTKRQYASRDPGDLRRPDEIKSSGYYLEIDFTCEQMITRARQFLALRVFVGLKGAVVGWWSY